MTTEVKTRALVRGVLDSLEGETIALSLPHTDYRLRLQLCNGAVAAMQDRVGRRVKGTIEAGAMKIHHAAGGGRFIEPVDGEPRIIAGTVLAVDDSAQRVLVDVAAPVWLVAESGQDFSFIRVGEMINCYVQSGATFTPELD